MKRRQPLAAGALLAAAALLTAGSGARAASFEAEGADTGAGLGAQHVAQGGTGVAWAGDAYAVYYNPAGLAEAEGFQLAVSRQLNATLHRVNFLGAAWRLPLAPAWGLKAGVGAAYYPRIHARAQGAYAEGDFESLFLRYLLPGIAGTFDGEIDTKTKSYRLALGIGPGQGDAWSLGAYVERIDCRSTFCGVHATSNGYTTSTTGATATGVGLGLRYRPAPAWTLAASISDLATRLTIDQVTTDADGTRTQQTDARFPRKISAGFAWRPTGGAAWAAEYEITKGRYGRSEIDLQVLRGGAEKRSGNWAWRAGAMVPLRIESTMTGRLKTPFPLSPTLGLGWQQGGVRVDLALYAHAVMSMHEDRASPAADLSLALGF